MNCNWNSSRPRRGNDVHGGPNWVLIAGGALLSSLTIRLGYKLKNHFFDKQEEGLVKISKGRGKINNSGTFGEGRENAYVSTHDEDGSFGPFSGLPERSMELNHGATGAWSTETDLTQRQLAVVTHMPLEASDIEKEAGAIWLASPDRIELPGRMFYQSNNGSESGCLSESSSDLFTKREVIQKLRQQLKRRDDMILEMQSQIAEQQKLVSERIAHAVVLQSQLDAANGELFQAEREIQQLRKVLACHCVSAFANSLEHHQVVYKNVQPQNGYVNAVVVEREVRNQGIVTSAGGVEKETNGERVEMLKKQASELREAIEGKDYLLLNYKEQKMELCSKVKELQLRLDSQVHIPNS